VRKPNNDIRRKTNVETKNIVCTGYRISEKMADCAFGLSWGAFVKLFGGRARGRGVQGTCSWGRKTIEKNTRERGQGH